MPLDIKILFTIVTAVIAVLIYFSDSGKGGAGPDHAWKSGRNDRVRQLLFRPDGSARRLMKVWALILFAFVLLILWKLVPTNASLHLA